MTILVATMYLFIFGEIWISRDFERDVFNNCLKIGTTWEYADKEQNFIVKLRILPEGNYNNKYIMNYNIDGEEGEWIIGFDVDRIERIRITGYYKDSETKADCGTWTGKANITSKKITINNIKNEELTEASETVIIPENIEKIELIRVK